jgi:hypothetical protein
LEDSNDNQIRDLFERLNKYSVPLNDQELRNARYQGCFLKAIESIAQQEEAFWMSSRIFSANDIRRMIDLEFISVLLSTIIGGIYNRKDDLDKYYEMYEDNFEDENQYVEKFIYNIDILKKIFPHINETMWKGKANFYTLFLVVDSIGKGINDENIETIRSSLNEFEKSLDNTKADLISDDRFKQYINSLTKATNDKENRVARVRILIDFLKSKIAFNS